MERAKKTEMYVGGGGTDVGEHEQTMQTSVKHQTWEDMQTKMTPGRDLDQEEEVIKTLGWDLRRWVVPQKPADK